MDTFASPIEWTRSHTKHFIDLLKQHPCIWNHKSKEYKMRHIRSASFAYMRKKLSPILNRDIKSEDIMKKMHTLKSQYQRELAAMKASQSDAGIDDVCKPKLWCFDELRFLGEADIRASASITQKISEMTPQAERNKEDVDVAGIRAPSPVSSSSNVPSPILGFPVHPAPSPSPTPSSSSVGYGGSSKKRKQEDHVSKTLEWTRSSTLYFIELLKQHPSIWNIKCKEYKMRDIKIASLETITTELSSFMNCVVRDEDVKKKLHTLKSQLLREMSAMKASKKSGDGTEDIYFPKLWCFDELLFLAEGEVIRASTSNSDERETTQQFAKTTSVVRDRNIIKMESTLSLWITYCRKKNVPLDSNIIREKARKLYNDLTGVNEEPQPGTSTSTPTEDFQASKDWFDSFQKRLNLKSVPLHGDSASADYAETTAYPEELFQLMEKVFNVNETGQNIMKGEAKMPGCKDIRSDVSVDSPVENEDVEDEMEETHEEVSESLSNSQNDETSSGPQPKRRKPNDDTLPHAFRMLQNVATAQVPQRDRFYFYGQYIAEELRLLDEYSAAHVQKLFAETIFDARMGKFKPKNPVPINTEKPSQVPEHSSPHVFPLQYDACEEPGTTGNIYFTVCNL
ncbi:uncharacterized protein LOC143021091 isoform X2 [Oratosquilla oratoria]|uniref:uncharacterized protein LOC143021091 isoform X2 n=1 Tax=Oratosquilla oratoria TaxID=337810 RepID=UPI003F75E0CE